MLLIMVIPIMICAVLFVILKQILFAVATEIIIEMSGFITQFLISNFKTVTLRSFMKFSEHVSRFENTIITKNPCIPNLGTKNRISKIRKLESIVL